MAVIWALMTVRARRAVVRAEIAPLKAASVPVSEYLDKTRRDREILLAFTIDFCYYLNSPY